MLSTYLVLSADADAKPETELLAAKNLDTSYKAMICTLCRVYFNPNWILNTEILYKSLLMQVYKIIIAAKARKCAKLQAESVN